MPNEPSADQVAPHNGTHEPFRAWYRASVSGGGLSSEHIVGGHQYDALAVVQFDCGLIGNDDGMPLMVGKIRNSSEQKSDTSLAREDIRAHVAFRG